ncbi:MAG TPA: hypothetical protein VGH40_22595 [Roseiarcus sp.]
MTLLKRAASKSAFAVGILLCVSTIAQAAMAPPPVARTSATKVQWYVDKCSPGFHGINAPNGNGYRCVPDER